ncbi:MAG: hypothetical protein ACHQHP_06670, partial [Bacteroidia bacterium]
GLRMLSLELRMFSLKLRILSLKPGMHSFSPEFFGSASCFLSFYYFKRTMGKRSILKNVRPSPKG